LPKKKTSLLSWFPPISLLEADCFRWALIGRLLAAACCFAVGIGFYMSQSIVTHLKYVWAYIGAHTAANAQVMINFRVHSISSLDTL
jgi:hypothetical protein